MNVDLEGCLRGDSDAWNAFVDQCSPLVFAAVRRTVHSYLPPGANTRHDATRTSGAGDHAHIADTVQDVFLRLIRDDCRTLRTFDSSRASLSTWLTVVARNVAIDALRKRRIDTVSLQPHHAPSSSSTGVGSNASENMDGSTRPASANIPLHLLTDRQLLVLRMLFEEGMSVPEAARMLGVNDQTIRSTKHKALTRLRDHFGVEAERQEVGQGQSAAARTSRAKFPGGGAGRG